ncbi:hypothetical protein [Pseudobacteriovorax antillogorgiicola]|uniref:Uncharacterized protein n=2 Tax=Pseudobacteriovorax antillogorgiicola TaxID=1513793 RepID=A0A1Y6CKZ7_9BACT|nr:hypothetical protein [Pseudobacteriovorax antillogorgiicola]TCS47658.1 hypothetical protein EDD56_12099 [Pseudobacteriovorax antillogorgiicola]SMF59793.1 hypothetical protein SAMN06296036_12041 [Pseudobacteriovorax antillogorgiicola]
MKEPEESIPYNDVLCQHAKKSMFWISLLGSIGLVFISVLNARIDFLSSFIYLPTLLVMFVTLVMYLSSSYRTFRYYRTLADMVCATGVLGATALVMRAHEIQFNLSTSPLQYSQMICFAICFRRRTIGVVRNTVVTIVSILSLAIYDSNLVSQMYVHYVGGYFAGMMIYIIAEDRLYKDYLYRQTVDRERQENSRKYRYLHGELTSKCLPHQIDLILKGLSYKETMPIHRIKFWTSKFILQSPDDILITRKHEIFDSYLSKLQDFMRSQYEFKYIPMSRLSDGHDVFEVRGPGYIAKSGQDNYTLTYEYPFPLPKNENKGQFVLATVFKQLNIFKQVVCDQMEMDNLVLISSLTYGVGKGIFSGELSNYEIEGECITFSETYLDARRGIPDLNEMIAEGHHAILIHPRVYRELQRYVPGFLESRVKPYKFTPHIRNDNLNDTIYVLYVHKNDSSDYYLEVQNWFRSNKYSHQA